MDPIAIILLPVMILLSPFNMLALPLPSLTPRTGQASLPSKKEQPHAAPPALITHYERTACRGRQMFLEEAYQMKLSGSLFMDRILGIV